MMQNNPLLTIVIPLFQNDETAKQRFVNALKSLNSQTNLNFNLITVCNSNINDEFISGDALLAEGYNWFNGDLGNVHNGENLDYASQINFAVSKVTTKFFSVLQYDDVVLPNYVDNILKNIEAFPENKMFCPLIMELDGEGNFIGMSNESVWATNHMQEFGYFDLKNTKQNSFHNYSLCGAAIEKEMFLSIGGFKPSLLKFGDYEFLLRVLNKNYKVSVIPKLMYKHYNGLVGSIFDINKTMSKEENTFWYNLSKKEYYFDYDRKIEYVPQA